MSRYTQFTPLLMFILLVGCVSNSDRSPYFVRTLKQDTLSREQLIEHLPGVVPVEYIAELPEAQVCVDAYEYNTITPDGKHQIASGIISYPASKQFKGVVVAQHFTFTNNRQVPSQRMGAIESLFSLYGFVVISADYLGYGSSVGMPHPYSHAASTARSIIDMTFAAREYMNSIHLPIADSVYVVGYSQGGHASLAFQREVEQNYADKIPIIRVVAGGGAYDLPVTFDEIIKIDTTASISTVPMLLLGLDYGDNLQFDYTKIFKEPLLSNYPAWILSKLYESSRINRKIGTHRVSDIITESVLKRESAEIEKINKSLVTNSLIDWTPKAPIVLIHGENDDYVPFANALNAYNSFKSKGCDVTLKTTEYGHVQTMVSYYQIVLMELTGKAILDKQSHK